MPIGIGGYNNTGAGIGSPVPMNVALNNSRMPNIGGQGVMGGMNIPQRVSQPPQLTPQSTLRSTQYTQPTAGVGSASNYLPRQPQTTQMGNPNNVGMGSINNPLLTETGNTTPNTLKPKYKYKGIDISENQYNEIKATEDTYKIGLLTDREAEVAIRNTLLSGQEDEKATQQAELDNMYNMYAEAAKLEEDPTRQAALNEAASQLLNERLKLSMESDTLKGLGIDTSKINKTLTGDGLMSSDAITDTIRQNDVDAINKDIEETSNKEVRDKYIAQLKYLRENPSATKLDFDDTVFYDKRTNQYVNPTGKVTEPFMPFFNSNLTPEQQQYKKEVIQGGVGGGATPYGLLAPPIAGFTAKGIIDRNKQYYQ